LFAYWKKYW